MGVQPNGSHHEQTHFGTAHQSSGRQQGCEGFSQAHFVGQNGTATGQEPTDPGALMTKRATAILQGFVKVRSGNKGPVRWQRWQGMLAPVEPLLQGGSDGKTPSEGLLKRIGCRQGEVPAMAWAVPATPGLDPTQLGLGDRIERADHANQPGWRKIQGTGQCGF